MSRRSSPQLDLFAAPRPEPVPPAERKVDVWFIRKVVGKRLRTLRNAARPPWPASEVALQLDRFPKLAALLPPEEGAEALADFYAELKRLGLFDRDA